MDEKEGWGQASEKDGKVENKLSILASKKDGNLALSTSFF